MGVGASHIELAASASSTLPVATTQLTGLRLERLEPSLTPAVEQLYSRAEGHKGT